MNVAGDLLYAGGKANRTVVYSMTTGAQVRQTFGHVISVDKASNRVCISNRNDEAIVYDEAGNKVSHLHAGSSIRFARFREKGTQLLLLTADQKVRTFNLSKENMMATK